MYKSRLFSLFSNLNAAEKAALRKFVASPYHNSRADVQRLLTFMLNNYGRNGALDKASVFAAIFPETAQYDDFKLLTSTIFD